MPNIDPRFLSQIRYRCIGPTRGGRVVAVAADPEQPETFYFGACAGGVWKSEDAGLFWENVSDGHLNTASIGALAVAPSNPNVIYAGTGESTIRNDVTHGDGVYKSTDAGASWVHVGLDESRHIGKICVHPHDPETVYVAALGYAFNDNPERGLYRSTDGGETWELSLHVGAGAGAVDVSIDPNDPRTLIATIWQTRRTFWSITSGGPDGGIWRSRDGGDTWEDISCNGGLPVGILGKVGVSISPARSGRVWAIIEAEGSQRGLYRSDDVGDTWTKMSSKPELTGRSWYYQHVVAHPTEADTVFVLNVKAWKSTDGGEEFEEFHTPHPDNHALWIDPTNPRRMIGGNDGGAWVSLNSGDSWSSVYNQPTAQIYHIDVDNQYPYLVYGTQQDNTSVAIPSHTGVGAITWGDCYTPGTAESGYVAVKPDDPNIVYVGAIGSSPGGGDSLQRYDHATKQIQLVSVWPELYYRGNSAEVRFAWTYPIVFSPLDTNVLYVAGNKVFRSTDEGHSWDAISGDLTYADPDTMGVSGPLTMDTAGAESYATVFSLMVSAHRSGVLMAGSDDGLVHVTTDDGQQWKNVTPPELPKFSQITMLAESPHDKGTIYMTVARHKMGDYAPYVFKTSDLGDTWEAITNGLPGSDFCRVVRADPNREGLLYLGTELGVYVSFDDGANWQSLQGNLPVSPVYDLVVKGTDLVVATHGRSIWILDDLTQLHQIRDELVDAEMWLLKPRDTVRAPAHLMADLWIHGFGFLGGKNYHVVFGKEAAYYLDEDSTGQKRKRVIDAGEDLERGVAIFYYLDEAPDVEATLTILDAAGVEIDSFSSIIPTAQEDREGPYITAAAGMNRFQWMMRHSNGTRMVDTEYHGRPAGPLAKPGVYTARLVIGEWEMEQTFALNIDPRVSASEDDLVEQFDLLIAIRDKLSEIAEGVNNCRAVKKRIVAVKEDLASDGAMADAIAAGDALVQRLDAVEVELVQAALTSPGDLGNHSEKVFEKLGALVPVVSSADARPTSQSYQVYAKLAGQADDQLAALNAIYDTDLAAYDENLGGLGLGAGAT